MIFKSAFRYFFLTISLGLSVIMAVSCSSEYDYWADSSSWYTDGRTYNPDLADVFYLVSTDVVDAVKPDGTKSFITSMNEDDRSAITPEMAKMSKVFGDSLNFIAPYYHQFTLETIDRSQPQVDSVKAIVADDVWDSFRHYIDNVNTGRPYVIVGFSQGAMFIPSLLERMSDDDFSHMAAAYMIGYRLSEDDLSRRHVYPATGEDDLGVTVSFNSVATPDAVWPLVSEGAATCINPLNWKTDSTPAVLEWHGDILTVSVLNDINVLLVEGADMSQFEFPMLDKYCKRGNLHHWDRKFYADSIRDNILLRTSFMR